MKRQTIIAAGLMAIAAAAAAQESPAIAEAVGWGAGNGSHASIALIGEGAEVYLQNELTGGHENLLQFDLTAGDIVVGIRVDHGPGDVPDRFTITPPPGFVAVPEVIDLDEGEGVAVAIVPLLLGELDALQRLAEAAP